MDRVTDQTHSPQALGVQVGGSHYTRLAIQPIEYSERNRLSPAQHTAIKYITRQKGDTLEEILEDLDKAKHCIDLYKQSLVEDWAGRNDPERVRRDIADLQAQLQRLEPGQQQSVAVSAQSSTGRGNGKTVPADRSVPSLSPRTKVRGSA